MRLTKTKIESSKPRERPYKLADGGGLTLLVKPNGSKLWRLRYRFGGLEKSISLGAYPETSLKLARDKRDDARRQLARGADPSAIRQAERAERANTFEEVGREWLGLQEKKLAAVTVDKARWLLETFIFPRIGSRPINDVTPAELLRALRRIEAKGIHESAHRARQRVSQVYRYAIAAGRADRDITADLRGALVPVKTSHRAALTDPSKIGELLRAIDGLQGQPSVMYALRLAPLVFVRPGELRAAEWVEFDLEAKEPVWRIPAERTKMREQHIVPLSTQAAALLRELRSHTSYSRYLFPSLRTKDRPISNNTLNAALRRLGYSKDEQTAHGFRTIASTLLNELGWHPDVIERQLAHAPRDKVRAAYNRAQRLPERRKMMQAWGDYLDVLRAAGADKVTAIRA